MSPKSIADKLLIKPNSTVWLSHPDRAGLIGPLPEGARVVSQPAQAAIALIFADGANSLRQTLTARRDQLGDHLGDRQRERTAGQPDPPRVLWVAYPKGNRADINRDTLWPILAEHGLRPVSQVAIDAVWSALRFRPLQPGEAPFTGGR